MKALMIFRMRKWSINSTRGMHKPMQIAKVLMNQQQIQTR